MGGKLQDKDNISNESQNSRVIIDLICRRTPGVFAQRCRHPLTPIRIYIEIFLARVYPETIIIIGRVSKNTLLWCIRIDIRNLSKGIIILIVNTQDFYTFPE